MHWQPVIHLLHELFPHDEQNWANDPNFRIKLLAAGSMSVFDQIFGL